MLSCLNLALSIVCSEDDHKKLSYDGKALPSSHLSDHLDDRLGLERLERFEVLDQHLPMFMSEWILALGLEGGIVSPEQPAKGEQDTRRSGVAEADSHKGMTLKPH